MSEPKWTAGPWKTTAKYRDITGPNGEVIVEETSIDAVVTKAQAAANAQLIAAAPDLYEILDEIINQVERQGWESKLYDQAKTILAQARGDRL